MDYEKKYKEALEWMQSLYSGLHGATKEDAEHYFPELKKNENERIRKGLIKTVSSLLDNTILYHTDVTKEEALAWLEKQGKSNTFKVPETSIKDAKEVASRMQHIKDDMKPIAEFIINYANWDLHKDEWNQPTLTVPLFRVLDALIQRGKPYGECVQNIEKQGENEPTDEVEPKFKVGDWVVSNDNGEFWQIGARYTEEGQHVNLYNVNDVIMPITLDVLNNDYHLWTIQDAKDGDVLCYHVPSTAFFLIGIFKRVAHKDELWGGTYRNYAQYGGYSSIENYTLQVALGNNELHHCGSIACPATKEQRDLLFQKMKEAGYEWDANKKELKKIGVKTIDADKVIKWLNDQACLGWIEDVWIDIFVEKFKEDFGL